MFDIDKKIDLAVDYAIEHNCIVRFSASRIDIEVLPDEKEKERAKRAYHDEVSAQLHSHSSDEPHYEYHG